MVRTVYDKLLQFIKLLIVIMTSLLITIVFFNVLSRFIFNFSIAWAEESARFLFIWLTFLGSVLVNDKYGHMNLDIVPKSLPTKAGNIIRILATSIMLILLLVLIAGTSTMVINNMSWKSASLEIPYGLVYSVAPVCCTIMALQSVARIIYLAKHISEPFGEDA